MSIDAIRDEMAKSANNQMIQRIGEFLTDYARRHPGAEAAFGAKGKSIAGAISALSDYAKRQPRSGNCAMVDDETAFAQVLLYYGIKGGRAEAAAPVVRDDFDIDALMDI